MDKSQSFKFQGARRLPVILMLDTSGSMSGSKIDVLNTAVREMLNDFASVDSSEVEIYTAIYTFGPDAQEIIPFMAAYEAERQYRELTAGGGTPLGAALNLVKNSVLENKETITTRDFRPIILLASDGEPNDDWESMFADFCETGRSSKCSRMALSIGVGPGTEAYSMLERFVSADQKVFPASDAREIKDFFNMFSQTTIARLNTFTAKQKAVVHEENEGQKVSNAEVVSSAEENTSGYSNEYDDDDDDDIF